MDVPETVLKLLSVVRGGTVGIAAGLATENEEYYTIKAYVVHMFGNSEIIRIDIQKKE